MLYSLGNNAKKKKKACTCSVQKQPFFSPPKVESEDSRPRETMLRLGESKDLGPGETVLRMVESKDSGPEETEC